MPRNRTSPTPFDALHNARSRQRTLKTLDIPAHTRNIKSPLLPYYQALAELEKIKNARRRYSQILHFFSPTLTPTQLRTLNTLSRSL